MRSACLVGHVLATTLLLSPALAAAGGMSSVPSWTADGPHLNAALGYSLSTAGDVNGDGYDDLLVGVNNWTGEAGYGEGGAMVFLGSAGGLAAAPVWSAKSGQADVEMGYGVGAAGDVNGDGYDDVIVGGWQYDDGEEDEGRAWVFHGNPNGVDSAAAWIANGDQAGARLGRTVRGAGDVNGDGYDDVIVGAHGYKHGQNGEGRAYVYLGSPAGLAAEPAWHAEGNQGFANFGISVAGAGDVNGDGYDDVIVGSRYFDGPEIEEGRAFVFLGSDTGLAALPAWTADPGQANAHFGLAVSGLGDVNGDGYDDVGVGAPDFDDDGLSNSGRAYVFLGSAAGLAASPAWVLRGTQALARLGWMVSPAGDVDGDGYDDVLVGIPDHHDPEHEEGAAAVYRGGPAGVDTVASWFAESDQDTAIYSWSAWTAGDVNGDGFDDVAVGSPLFNVTVRDQGRAFVYHGASALTAVEDRAGDADATAPALLSLGLARPNPFNPRVEIPFRLAAPARVRVAIHDVAGRLVATLAAGERASGDHLVTWEGTDARGLSVASGVYFARLTVEGGSASERDRAPVSRTLRLVLLR